MGFISEIEKQTPKEKQVGSAEYVPPKGIDEMTEVELLREILKSTRRTATNVAFFFYITIISIFLYVGAVFVIAG